MNPVGRLASPASDASHQSRASFAPADHFQPDTISRDPSGDQTGWEALSRSAATLLGSPPSAETTNVRHACGPPPSEPSQ